MVNEILLTATGIVNQDMAELLSSTQRNSAMIFGPAPGSGAVGDFLSALCPSFFETAPYDVPSLGLARGDTLYWPVIWLLVPGLVIVFPFCLVLSLFFGIRRTKLSRLKH
jgi:hypothetical protein